MKRQAIALTSTVSGLVLLFSYPTSRGERAGDDLATQLDAATLGASAPSPSVTRSSEVTPEVVPDPSPEVSPTPDVTRAPSPTPSPTAETTPSRKPTTPAVTEKATATPKRTTPAPTTRSVTGAAADTEYGPVQVAITVRSGKIVSADVVQVPMNNHHDEQINNHAVPLLNQDAVTKQSAELDAISGATATVDGYKVSLQSAIDQARI